MRAQGPSLLVASNRGRESARWLMRLALWARSVGHQPRRGVDAITLKVFERMQALGLAPAPCCAQLRVSLLDRPRSALELGHLTLAQGDLAQEMFTLSRARGLVWIQAAPGPTRTSRASAATRQAVMAHMLDLLRPGQDALPLLVVRRVAHRAPAGLNLAATVGAHPTVTVADLAAPTASEQQALAERFQQLTASPATQTGGSP